jgi:hypothetical protein
MRELGHDALQTKSSLDDDLRNSTVARRGVWTLVFLAEIAMQIKIDTSSFRQTKWHEYGIRFVVGGLITAVAGVIAKEFGPVIGGVFLAFPAIFPASATLIENHEKEKKEKEGLAGTERGREAAAVDAAGSAMGSIGLLIFAFMVWRLMPAHAPWLVLAGATLAWLAVSVLIWEIRKRA